MEYHSIVSKISYVFDQYVYYNLIPKKGYSYDIQNGELEITYHWTNLPSPQHISSMVYQEKKEELFNFIRKAAKTMIKLDAYSKVIIRQHNGDGEEVVEEIY